MQQDRTAGAVLEGAVSVLFAEPGPPVAIDAICTKCRIGIARLGAVVGGTWRGWCLACWNAWVEARRDAAARESEF